VSVHSTLAENGEWRKAEIIAMWKKKLDGMWSDAIFDPLFVNSNPVVSNPTSSEGSLILQ
jgi:hypothetical protein